MARCTKYMFTWDDDSSESSDSHQKTTSITTSNSFFVELFLRGTGKQAFLSGQTHNPKLRIRFLPSIELPSLQRTMESSDDTESIWEKLPDVLWPIVGDFIFMEIHEHGDSLRLKMKPSTCFAIVYPGDEEPGVGFIQPCTIS